MKINNVDGIVRIARPKVMQAAKKSVGVLATLALVFSTMALAVPQAKSLADTSAIDFETYATGNINGQSGWSATGSAGSGCAVYDEGVSSSMGVTGFGNQSFRISNAVTSGCFGDQAFAPALSQPAGEIGASNGSYGSVLPVSHFESQFDIYAIADSIGDVLSVSPDQGNGARMSYLRFDNEADGIHVYFDDVQGTTNPANFVETELSTLSASTPHTVKFAIDFVDGPSNDIVNIYIDGNNVHTGTTWENYFRFDPESNPTLDHNFTPTVRTMLFRAGGTAVPSTMGKGYLIDNLSMASSSPAAATCPAGTVQGSLLETVPVNPNSPTAVASTNTLANGQIYLLVSSGTWTNDGLNVADTEFASTDSWATVMDGYDISPYFLGEGEFDLQVNGSFVNWGTYNPAHTYSYLYTGNGSNVNLGVFDGDSNTGVANPGWYGDNSGSLNVDVYPCNPSTVKVTIDKYVDGVQADSTNANSSAFPMNSTWVTTNIGSGSGTYTLSPVGFNNLNPYFATTSEMNSGADYTTNEITGGTVGATNCGVGQQFFLAGYTTGDTLADAAVQTPTMTIPTFTDLTSNKVVIVWNKSSECPAAPAVAAAYLKSLNKKPGTSSYKNIISQVAHEMGPGTEFHGLQTYQAGYSDAVKAFINGL